MTRKTHVSLGIALTLPLLTNRVVNAYAVLGLLGSLAPDWDFKLYIPHRTLTHCLLTLSLSTYLIYNLNIDICISWFLNYFLHLFADSLTKRGIPLFYPFSRKYYGARLFKTGGIMDFLLFLFSILFILIQLKYVK